MKHHSLLVFSSAVVYILTFFACQSDPQSTDTAAATSSTELPPEQADFPEATYKWGYIGRSGDLLIPARYDDARSFQEGRAMVQIKGNWGIIDLRGKTIVEPQYKGIGHTRTVWLAFSPGRSRWAFWIRWGRW